MKTDDPNENYYSLTNTFIDIVTKYAPLKKKFIRENKAPFMTTELRIEICTKRRFRNKYCKTLLKKIKKNCIKTEKQMRCLWKKCIREYFHNITDDNISTD